MKHYIPEADETKGSLEIIFEIIGQVLIILIGLFYIHRIIIYIPTYSKDSYPPLQLTNLILVILFITLSLQTKLGEKATILYERVGRVINGEETIKPKEPVKQNPNATAVLPPPAVTREMVRQESMNGNNLGSTPIHDSPNFNQMYQQNPTPLVNAQTPGMEQMGPPPLMAANEALGGGFGSMF